MPSRQGSIVRRRILARELRRLREGHGLGLAEAAAALDASASTLSRIETASQPVSVHMVRSMLDLYDEGERWDELIALTRAALKPGWWHAYGVGNDSYIGYEAEASRVQEFSATVIPGLLQTPEYIRALFSASLRKRADEQRETDRMVRLIRQRRLRSDDNPLELHAVIDEPVLHRAVGGSDVLRRQLEYLAEAATLDRVQLQVLPGSVGARPALASGFTVLHFADLDEPDLAYVEHAFGSAFLDQDGEVAKLAFGQLSVAALGPADSLALIERLAGRP